MRRRRRDLSLDEAGWLLRAALAGAEDFRGLTGEDRHFLYAVALATGFRAAELGSLNPESFNLDGDPPTVTVEGAYAKNGETAVQPLPRELAGALRPYLARKPAGLLVWPGSWCKVAFRMIARDLTAARSAWIGETGADAAERRRREQSGFLAYRNEAGTADFHSLRHSFITWLAKSGIHPKMAQSLARHSTITLTMDRYSHVGLFDQSKAVESLPSLLSAGPGRGAEPLAATGTDPRRAPNAHQIGATSCQRLTTH